MFSHSMTGAEVGVQGCRVGIGERVGDDEAVRGDGRRDSMDVDTGHMDSWKVG